MLVTPFAGVGDIDHLAFDEEITVPFQDRGAKLEMQSPSSPHILWAKIIVPWILVLLTTAPAWRPVLCRRLASLCCSMRSAMSVTIFRSSVEARRPELLSASLVFAVAFLGLLLGRGGHLSDDKKLIESEIEMRRLWPTMVHPDSLLVLQQLLRAAGVGFLILRGCHESCDGGFAPVFLQMALGSAMRLLLWGFMQDYELEGPLGGSFVVWCVALTFHVQCFAACRAALVANEASQQRKKFLCFKFCAQLILTALAASANHFTVGNSTAADIMFAAIHACDLCATPLFSVMACLTAMENIVSICPALVFMCAGDFLGFSWFMHFVGVGLTNAGGEEKFKRALLVVKARVLNSGYGNPIMLLFTSHLVPVVLMTASCIAAMGLQHGYFQALFSRTRPKGAPKEVIDKLEIVPYRKGMFGDEPNECCAVCLAEFEVGEELRCLPCQHQQFHVACVDHWLRRAGRCPLCIASVDQSEHIKAI